ARFLAAGGQYTGLRVDTGPPPGPPAAVRTANTQPDDGDVERIRRSQVDNAWELLAQSGWLLLGVAALVGVVRVLRGGRLERAGESSAGVLLVFLIPLTWFKLLQASVVVLGVGFRHTWLAFPAAAVVVTSLVIFGRLLHYFYSEAWPLGVFLTLSGI